MCVCVYTCGRRALAGYEDVKATHERADASEFVPKMNRTRTREVGIGAVKMVRNATENASIRVKLICVDDSGFFSVEGLVW